MATGEPVGSKTLVERSGLSVSPSTVRSELAALESLGLLSHPHTSAGRIPTGAGYRFYAEEVLERQETRPPRFPLDLTSMRSEVEAALQSTTEMLSQVTRLLALVSAPGLETATVRHIEVLVLQPSVVMVVTITSTGGVAKKLVTFDLPVDQGLASWANEYLNERLAGRRARHPSAAQADRRPEPLHAGARVSRRPSPFVPRAGRSDRAVALRRRSRIAPRRCPRGRARGLPKPALGAREAGGRARADDRRLRRAPARSSGSASTIPVCTTSRSSARPTAFRPGSSARSACSAPCGWTTTRPFGRCAQPPTSSPASSRRRTTRASLGRWRRLNGTTTSCSASSEPRPRPRSRRPSGSSRASCTPTSRRSRMRRHVFGPSPRRTRCSRRPRRASSTTATATRASGAAATRRATSTSRT